MSIPKLRDLKQLPQGSAVIWFSATWCGPCKKIDTITLSERSAELRVPVFHCDVDDAESIATHFGITSVPTFLLVKNGQSLNPSVASSGPSTQSWLRVLKIAASE